MSSTASSCRKKPRRRTELHSVLDGLEIRPTKKQSRSGPVSRVLSPPVHKAWAEDGHFSRTPVTRRLQQPTRASGGRPDQPARYITPVREALPKETSANALLGLAPGGVCQASRVAPAAGALLPHRFTLTAPRDKTGAHARQRRFVFCGTFPSLAAGRR